jgi:hypothetical protein
VVGVLCAEATAAVSVSRSVANLIRLSPRARLRGADSSAGGGLRSTVSLLARILSHIRPLTLLVDILLLDPFAALTLAGIACPCRFPSALLSLAGGAGGPIIALAHLLSPPRVVSPAAVAASPQRRDHRPGSMLQSNNGPSPPLRLRGCAGTNQYDAALKQRRNISGIA